MKKNLFTGAVAALLLVATCFLIAERYKSTKDAKVFTPVGFTMHSEEYYNKDGVKHLLRSVVRVVSANSHWKEVNTLFQEDGRVNVQTTGGETRGTLKVSGNQLQLVGASTLSSGWDDSAYRSAKGLRGMTQFIRESSFLGYQTYVLQTPKSESGQYAEFEYSPIFGSTPLRMINYDSGEQVILEAIKIDLAEPAQEVIDSVGCLRHLDADCGSIRSSQQSGTQYGELRKDFAVEFGDEVILAVLVVAPDLSELDGFHGHRF